MREMLKVYVPAILLIVAGFVVALRFVAPPPPKEIRLATGGASGFYHQAGQRYRSILARDGINVVLVETEGSLDNLRRLTTERDRVDIAFVQGGLTTDLDTSGLVALAGTFYEPVWVLVRNGVRATRLTDLKNQRIAIGSAGSGTQSLARQLLAANGVGDGAARFVEFGTTAALTAMEKNEIDAAFIVIAAPSQPMIDIVARGTARLLPFNQADAYQMKFPFLSPVRLPMGAADLTSNVPSTDVRMIAPTAALIAREDIHPALVTLLLNAAREIHAAPQLFAPANAFPTKNHLDFPLHPDAERYFDRGPSFLFRYLPFGVAVLVERMVVLLIPLITLLIPIIRLAPPAYRWQVQRKIYKWYKQLRLLEDEALGADRVKRAEIKAQLDDMQLRLEKLNVPTSYAQQLYHLRQHLDFVRARLV
jgi:uncharacterized protein